MVYAHAVPFHVQPVSCTHASGPVSTAHADDEAAVALDEAIAVALVHVGDFHVHHDVSRHRLMVSVPHSISL